MLNINEVLIIQGHTGCGKTTQVPQFILEQCRTRNQLCNIVVTQPRRIAAISVAHRVCEERNWGIGTVCGYQVRKKKKCRFFTRFNFFCYLGWFGKKFLSRYTFALCNNWCVVTKIGETKEPE